MGKVIAVCTSEKKGVAKTVVDGICLQEGLGILKDAHAGTWHRQVSLLALERIEEFRKRGAKVSFGAFGENVVTEGINLRELPVGTRLTIGEVVLEVTQIGKECHDHCAIYTSVGDCIMPREGIFARVLQGGEIHPEDEITVIPPGDDRPFTAAVITLSDRCYAGEREDKSGPAAVELLEKEGLEVVETLLLPDGRDRLEAQLKRLADQRQVSVIFTTGGTGFSERDVTPEATCAVCERMAPGIAEAIRAYSMTVTANACLSRAVSGIRGTTLIVNLPGSEKAVREALTYMMKPLIHGLDILRGTGDN